MRAAAQFTVQAFVLFSSSSNAAAWPNSCVGNFCMFTPPTERQFVELYGKGGLRRYGNDNDNDVQYRCFYDNKSHQWAEFTFSRHGDRGPRHLEGTFRTSRIVQ